MSNFCKEVKLLVVSTKQQSLKIVEKNNSFYVRSLDSKNVLLVESGPFSYKEAIAFREMNHLKRKRYKKRLFISEVKNRPCEDCGEKKDISLMTFDHIKDKKFDLADGPRKSWKIIQQELEKCEVVCRSCHNVREFLRGRTGALRAIEDLAELLRRMF